LSTQLAAPQNGAFRQHYGSYHLHLDLPNCFGCKQCTHKHASLQPVTYRSSAGRFAEAGSSRSWEQLGPLLAISQHSRSPKQQQAGCAAAAAATQGASAKHQAICHCTQGSLRSAHFLDTQPQVPIALCAATCKCVVNAVWFMRRCSELLPGHLWCCSQAAAASDAIR
jgi:hypothetical protein